MRARWRCSARRRRAQAGAPPSEGTEGPSLAPARLPPPVPCQTASRPRPAFSVRSPTMRAPMDRSEEHTSELQSLMRISYAVFCLNKQILLLHSSPDDDVKTTDSLLLHLNHHRPVCTHPQSITSNTQHRKH